MVKFDKSSYKQLDLTTRIGKSFTSVKYKLSTVGLFSFEPPRNVKTRHTSTPTDNKNGKAIHATRPGLTMVKVLRQMNVVEYVSTCKSKQKSKIRQKEKRRSY